MGGVKYIFITKSSMITEDEFIITQVFPRGSIDTKIYSFSYFLFNLLFICLCSVHNVVHKYLAKRGLSFQSVYGQRMGKEVYVCMYVCMYVCK